MKPIKKKEFVYNEDELLVCPLCGMIHTEDDSRTLHTKHGEKKICNICAVERFIAVFDSNDFFTTDTSVVIDGVAYSEEFANNCFTPCEHCGKLVIDVDRIDGRQICNDCFVANNK